MTNNVCAPNKYDDKNKTCFSTSQLMEMAKAYNRYIAKSKLNPNRIQSFGNISLIDIKNDKTFLLSEFRKRFQNVCGGDDICITHQAFMNDIVKEMRNDIQTNTFRSSGPQDPKEWLSTVDINNIMSQYESVYPHFKFMGAVPLNCDEYSFCKLYKMNFDEHEKNGVKNMGIIFNLDRHGQPGSHWVALYINIAGGEIYFCDSNGKPPIDNISGMINQFARYYRKNKGKDVVYKYNTIPYQKDSSECGIYSCNFIIRKLAGESFDDIVNNALDFKQINSCRNVYFRNKPSQFTAHPKCDPIGK